MNNIKTVLKLMQERAELLDAKPGNLVDTIVFNANLDLSLVVVKLEAVLKHGEIDSVSEMILREAKGLLT